MKTAIYVEDGVVQLVLTPECDFEKNALSSFENKPLTAQIFVGSFYDSRGGWIKQSEHSNRIEYLSSKREERSVILRVNTVEPEIFTQEPTK